jgi:pimeloyl-ACP methyl ester carboxylesterase
VHNIVLVHGAFADGSSWSAVIPLLQRKGYRVTAVPNPLTSLATMSRPPAACCASWAGAVITEAGNDEKVKALVPDSHESVAELMTRLQSPMEGLQPDAEGLVWLDDPAASRKVMAGDVPPAKASLLAAAQQPMTARAFGEKVSQAAWRSKPSWYLVTENDQALPPRVQRLLAEQIRAGTVTVKASHMSLVSHPRVVANLINRAALIRWQVRENRVTRCGHPSHDAGRRD